LARQPTKENALKVPPDPDSERQGTIVAALHVKTALTHEQRTAIKQFIEGLGLLREAVGKIEATWPTLREVPECVAALELAQRFPSLGQVPVETGHQAEGSKRPERPPMTSIAQVIGAASGLSEALSILCDGKESEHERRETLEETWWYLDWFHRSNIAVELKGAEGEILTLQRDTLPSQVVHYVCLRPMHTLSWRGQLDGQVQDVLNEIEKYRTPLGPSMIVLPVKAGEGH
jgi:hypothetical protein